MICPMKAARIVREARRRANLSQAELAARLGTTQSAIARWEAGRTVPSFDAVVAAVRAAGLEFHYSIALPDPDHDLLIADALRKDPEERIADLASRVAADEVLRGAAVR